jgi:cytochrome P450
MGCPVHPPGPKSRIPGRLYFQLRRDPLGFLTRAAQRFGDIVHLQVGPRHDCLVNNPEYIKEILVAPEGMARSSARPLKRLLGKGLLTSDGEYHDRQRKLLQPLFNREQIAAWTTVMTGYSARLRDRWQPGSTVDATEEMMGLALAIIIKVVLDLDIEREGAKLLDLLHVICKVSNQNTFPTLGELLSKLPFSSARRLQRSIGELDVILYRMIAERRSNGENHDDLLSSLIGLRDPQDSSLGLTDIEVRDEALTLITAGHETLGNALSWTWYLLSQNSGAEAQLHAEVDRVLEGRLPAADDLTQLPYTEMVFTESMRLYPPVWIFPRRPLHDYKVGEYEVPAGSYFQLCPYVTQRDLRYFADPERFDPQRWAPGEAAKRPRFSYFPFASGPHKCIGESFALAEGLLAIATIAQKWSLRLVPGHPVELAPLITLRSKHGMRMTLHPRK